MRRDWLELMLELVEDATAGYRGQLCLVKPLQPGGDEGVDYRCCDLARGLELLKERGHNLLAEIYEETTKRWIDEVRNEHLVQTVTGDWFFQALEREPTIAALTKALEGLATTKQERVERMIELIGERKYGLGLSMPELFVDKCRKNRDFVLLDIVERAIEMHPHTTLYLLQLSRAAIGDKDVHFDNISQMLDRLKKEVAESVQVEGVGSLRLFVSSERSKDLILGAIRGMLPTGIEIDTFIGSADSMTRLRCHGMPMHDIRRIGKCIKPLLKPQFDIVQSGVDQPLNGAIDIVINVSDEVLEWTSTMDWSQADQAQAEGRFFGRESFINAAATKSYIHLLDEMFEASRLQGPRPVDVLVARAWVALAEVRADPELRKKLERVTQYPPSRHGTTRADEYACTNYWQIEAWIKETTVVHDAKTVAACKDQLAKLRGETPGAAKQDASGEQHIEALRRYITRGPV